MVRRLPSAPPAVAMPFLGPGVVLREGGGAGRVPLHRSAWRKAGRVPVVVRIPAFRVDAQGPAGLAAPYGGCADGLRGAGISSIAS